MEIFVNGISEGIAARGIPLPSEENKIWAVIDMYGACQQISVHNQQPVSEADWELPQDIQQQEIESDGQGSMVSTDFTCQTDFTSSGKSIFLFKALAGQKKLFVLPNTGILHYRIKSIIFSIIRSFTWKKFRIIQSIAESWSEQFW